MCAGNESRKSLREWVIPPICQQIITLHVISTTGVQPSGSFKAACLAIYLGHVTVVLIILFQQLNFITHFQHEDYCLTCVHRVKDSPKYIFTMSYHSKWLPSS
jgi:hypothetical protein